MTGKTTGLDGTSLKLADVQPPPYNVLVMIHANIHAWEEKLRTNDRSIPPLVIACLNDMYYPVGNLDVLEAHKNAGSKIIECVVKQVKSMTGVLEAHLAHSSCRTYNPIAMIDAVVEMSESGADIKVIPEEYRDIAKIKLSAEARKKIDLFMRELGRTQQDIPSMMHVLFPLAKIKKSKQSEAASKILNYAIFKKRFIPPDNAMIKSILGQYDDAGSDAVNRVTFPELKRSEKSNGRKSRSNDDDDTSSLHHHHDDVGAGIKKDANDTSTCTSAMQDTIQHRCKCNRLYTINLKSATIREIYDKNSRIVADSEAEKGRVSHLINGCDAEFLQLELPPSIRTYQIGGSRTGHTLIVTKRKMSKNVILALGRIIDQKTK